MQFKSVIDLSDALVIVKALTIFRDYCIPSNLSNDSVLMKRVASEARYRIAEYNYEQVKSRLYKNKKVSEEELKFVQQDLKLAGDALFKT
ncbi:MAG: hypothetical protein M0Q13_12695 [Methanothrix sp.]|jgi:hypothetical protein|nr:hypothetical protein [Methanothrix sp.]